jgi:hypothetical protein
MYQLAVKPMTRARSRLGSSLAVSALLIASAAWAGAPSASGGAGKNYSGHVIGSPAARISFHIIGDVDHPRRARVRLTGIRLRCEDGTGYRLDQVPESYGFLSRRVFDGVFYGNGHPTAYESFVRVHGVLTANGVAHGTVFAYENPYDPPGTGGTDPECTTKGGDQHWRAEA